MLWVILGVMSLAAVVFATRPLLRDIRGQGVLAGIAIVFVLAASAGLYVLTGSPGLPSGPGKLPDVGEMVTSLAKRLEAEPDDSSGWKMLGRSYMTLGDFAGAVNAYERAVELESSQNAQTLVDLGLALAQAAGQQLTPRAVSLFENALKLDRNHPEALFYAGIAASDRGETALAADRWQTLLATNPPAEVRSLLEQRIAIWRGEPVPVAVQPAPQASTDVVELSVSLSDEASRALPANATLFLIARDPAQPAPPIAVSRRQLSELPAVIGLGDRESMIPGRELSGFDLFEVVARVSLAGNPAAQPGDWFTSAIVRPADGSQVSLLIDTLVE